ncbi:MAG: sugar phosphate nucleotidyltransferase [Chitinophagaceae bacterium]
MRINHTLIMAAGRGSRMMPLTDAIPKAMAIYGSSTLIANSIDNLKKSSLNIHITVGYKGADLAKHVIEHDVASIFNTEGKGNCWWIFNTLLNQLDEPVLVLTCDNIISINLDLIYKDYISLNSPACMVVPVKPVPGLEGDYIFEQENRVTELNRHKPSEIYCSGIQLINPRKINEACSRTDDFNDLWKQLIGKGMLYSSNIYPDAWFTVDTMEQLAIANQNK